MKSVMCFTVLMVVASATPLLNDPNQRDTSACPYEPPGLIYTCIFKIGVSCLSDDDCSNGQICCGKGCGSRCKTPVTDTPVLGNIGK